MIDAAAGHVVHHPWNVALQKLADELRHPPDGLLQVSTAAKALLAGRRLR